VANYNVSKATFGSGLQLDPVIAAALSAVVMADKDGDKNTLSVTEPLTSGSQVSTVSSVTDVLTFALSANGIVDLANLPKPPKTKGKESSSSSGTLDVIAFNNDAAVDLRLASFKGAVLLGNGNDKVSGGGGALAINAGGGNDSITTGSSADTIVAGTGNDTVNSGSGADRVWGGEGNDRIDAGADADSIYSGTGSDTIIAGTGSDRIIIEAIAGDAKVIDGGTGRKDTDYLDLSLVNITSANLAGSTLNITLDTGATLTVTNIEQFVYDNNGAAAGGVITVGLTQFLADPDF